MQLGLVFGGNLWAWSARPRAAPGSNGHVRAKPLLLGMWALSSPGAGWAPWDTLALAKPPCGPRSREAAFLAARPPPPAGSSSGQGGPGFGNPCGSGSSRPASVPGRGQGPEGQRRPIARREAPPVTAAPPGPGALGPSCASVAPSRQLDGPVECGLQEALLFNYWPVPTP